MNTLCAPKANETPKAKPVLLYVWIGRMPARRTTPRDSPVI